MARALPYAGEDVDVDVSDTEEGTRIQPIARGREPEAIGPYTLYEEIGCGGMATVHLGQLRSASGFVRTVAIKRMHAELARSPEFVAMFFDEARLAGRVQHPNVVAALDCVVCDGTTLLVMDYVHGVSLDEALHLASQAGFDVPLPIASAILIGALLGLHAAHEASDDEGKSLGIVHRDVSPHNILIGVDGVARVLDFGIAKAAERAHHTRTGEVKGKLGYMAPEQLFNDDSLGREADVYSVGVILWEILTGRRLFANDSHGQTLMRVANGRIDAPRSVRPDIAPAMEAIAMKALARQPKSRYRSARELAIALESTCPPAPQRVVGDWLASIAEEPLRRRWALKCGVDGSRERDGDTGTSGVRDGVTSRFRQPMPQVVPTKSNPQLTSPARSQSSRLWPALVLGGVALASGTLGSVLARSSRPAVTAVAARDSQVRPPEARSEEKPPVIAAAPAVPAAAEASPAADATHEHATPETPVSANAHAAAARPIFRSRPARPAPGSAAATPPAQPAAAAAPPSSKEPELGAIGGRE
jgi:serine/threonine-protein kinase